MRAVKFRRKLLDAVVWLRDAWYLICGHLARLTRMQKRPVGKSANRTGADSGFTTQAEDWAKTRASLSRYFELLHENRGEAEKMLTRWLKPPEQLVLQLVEHDTLQVLRGVQCISQVVQQIKERARCMEDKTGSLLESASRKVVI